MKVLGGMEDGTGRGPGEEVLGNTRGAVERRKLWGNEEAGPDLSGGYIGGVSYGSLECAGPGEEDTLSMSERNRVGINLGLYIMVRCRVPY